MTGRPIVGTPEWANRQLTASMRAALARLNVEPIAATGGFRRTCEALLQRGMATRDGFVYGITEYGRAVADAGIRDEESTDG